MALLDDDTPEAQDYWDKKFEAREDELREEAESYDRLRSADDPNY